MHAEIMAIGDELTSGQRLDTNSSWLSSRLAEIGIETDYHTTAPDRLAPLVGALRVAIARADVLVVTGGLGPTADDLTREALAEVLDAELELDVDSLRVIEGMFKDRSVPMPERNRRQAFFPAGARPIPNPHGTAPGIFFIFKRDDQTQCAIFALPGVPGEMYPMWHNTVSPQLLTSQNASQVIRHRRIHCFGEGESAIEARLGDMIERGNQPEVGITAHGATITLRITARGSSADACEAQMQPLADKIYRLLGNLIFGEGDDELQHAVTRLLAAQEKTLATAECGTAGKIAAWMSAVGGSSYRGGIVASTETPDEVTADCESLASGGASACRQQFAADFGLAVGPLPPNGSSEPKQIHFALATEKTVIHKTATAAGHPALITERTAKAALNALRQHLLGGE